MLTTKEVQGSHEGIQPFSADFQVTWADLDYNRHLKNTAYLDYAAQTRFLYLSSKGFGPEEFARHGIGPAVVSETITYRRELNFLQDFRVEFLTGGANAAGSRYIAVNRIVSGDGHLHAELRSIFVWFDLRQRKATPAPPTLAAAMNALVRTDDFAILD